MAGIKRQQLQAFLKSKAPTMSRSVLTHMRWHLSGIFKMAWADGVVDHNPAGELFVPECKPEGEKRITTRSRSVSLFPSLVCVIFRMAGFEGICDRARFLESVWARSPGMRY